MPVIVLSNPTPDLASMPVFPAAAVAVTPADADTFSLPATIYVGGAGNVRVLPANGGAAVTFFGLLAGSVVPCQVLGVMATGTTATSMIAVY